MWLLSRHVCFIYFFRSSTEPAVFAQCVWATLDQLLGSASPYVRLRVRGVAVTDSVRFCGGGFDSFLGLEYGVVITLASHVFEYFFLFFLQACGFCAFLASLGSQGVVTPPFWPALTRPFWGSPAGGLRLAALLLRLWFAWGWGLSCDSWPLPPLFSFLCLRSYPFRCFPFGVLPPYRVGWHVLSPVCWSTLPFGWRGLTAPFSSVPVRCFPWCRYVGIFGLLLLRLAGVVGAFLPVSGCSCCGVVCLVCRWGSPAAFPLP